MQRFYKTNDNKISVIDEFETGCWMNITDPSADELRLVAETHDIELDFLLAALDEEESPRIESENGQLLVIVDIPYQENDSITTHLFNTLPLVIILTKQAIVTVTTAKNDILSEFSGNKIKGFYTQFKTRFVLQILYRISQRYMIYLRSIERSSLRLEDGLLKSLTNKELVEMLRLQKSLVYLSTSLRANGLVLERLLRNPNIKNYQEDEDLLEDVIIENRQAIQMADIYSSILATTSESFASIISNNQNNIVKLLTSATIVMTIPTIISGLMGMNVPLPFNGPNGFLYILILIAVLALLVGILLWRRKFF